MNDIVRGQDGRTPVDLGQWGKSKLIQSMLKLFRGRLAAGWLPKKGKSVTTARWLRQTAFAVGLPQLSTDGTLVNIVDTFRIKVLPFIADSSIDVHHSLSKCVLPSKSSKKVNREAEAKRKQDRKTFGRSPYY